MQSSKIWLIEDAADDTDVMKIVEIEKDDVCDDWDACEIDENCIENDW